MECIIEGLRINYNVYGKGPSVIFLHGWGMNGLTFLEIANNLSEKYQVYTIDLPGFGKSDLLKALDIGEVCSIVHEFVEQNKIIKPTLICHSYGGRIGMMYAARYEIKGLVLISSPGFKKKLSLVKKMNICIYKLCKKVNINLPLGSNDYKNANELLKKMLVKTVNYDLKLEMSKINAPTIILAGENDKVVLLSEEERINKYIKNSKLIVIKGASHFPYLERKREVSLIIMAFLEGIM